MVLRRGRKHLLASPWPRRLFRRLTSRQTKGRWARPAQCPQTCTLSPRGPTLGKPRHPPPHVGGAGGPEPRLRAPPGHSAEGPRCGHSAAPAEREAKHLSSHARSLSFNSHPPITPGATTLSLLETRGKRRKTQERRQQRGKLSLSCRRAEEDGQETRIRENGEEKRKGKRKEKEKG